MSQLADKNKCCKEGRSRSRSRRSCSSASTSSGSAEQGPRTAKLSCKRVNSARSYFRSPGPESDRNWAQRPSAASEAYLGQALTSGPAQGVFHWWRSDRSALC
eukprot:15446941-Alexandrium_andersonii.AAC.1